LINQDIFISTLAHILHANMINFSYKKSLLNIHYNLKIKTNG